MNAQFAASRWTPRSTRISPFAASAAACWTSETGRRKNTWSPSRSSTKKEKTLLNPASPKVMSTRTEHARPVLALAIATSLGAGYLPLAPGTWGSAVGVALVAVVAAATRGESAPLPLVAEFTLVLAVAAIGLLASERVVEADPSNTDPGYVVIDEVSGQAITLVVGLALSAWAAPPHGVGVVARI